MFASNLKLESINILYSKRDLIVLFPRAVRNLISGTVRRTLLVWHGCSNEIIT